MTENKTPDFCVYDGSDYQKAFWDDANRAYEDRSEDIAFKKLLPKSVRLQQVRSLQPL